MTQAAAPQLRLTESQDEVDVFRLERRRTPRHTVTSSVTAISMDATQDGGQNRICSLELMNMSDGGLGALVSEPVAPDTRIAIFFPAHGPERSFDVCGSVVRCTRRGSGTGYEIGVRFDRRVAAA